MKPNGVDPELIDHLVGEGGGVKHLWVYRPAIERREPNTIAIQGPAGAARLIVATCKILGPSEICYTPEKPIRGGAHVYVETRAVIAWRRGDGRVGFYR